MSPFPEVVFEPPEPPDLTKLPDTEGSTWNICPACSGDGSDPHLVTGIQTPPPAALPIRWGNVAQPGTITNLCETQGKSCNGSKSIEIVHIICNSLLPLSGSSSRRKKHQLNIQNATYRSQVPSEPSILKKADSCENQKLCSSAAEKLMKLL